MADEVRLFGRLSVYALVVGTVYWFVSYEAAGTVLLLAFGIATGIAFILLWERARAVQAASGRAPRAATGPDGPFGDESGPVPTRSAAPLVVGFGIAVLALAGAFGPWFVIAGAVPLAVGAWSWLRSAMRELDLRGASDARAAEGHHAPAADDRGAGRRPTYPAGRDAAGSGANSSSR